MKKYISILLLIFILTVGAQTWVLANDNEVTNLADVETHGTAAYASEAPVIDGIIDEIWKTTESFYCSEGWSEGAANGYGQVLWSEDMLYLMAKVEDSTFSGEEKTNMGNSVTFWVSEARTAADGFETRGDWIYCVNAAGNLRYRSEVSSTAQCATKCEDGYYVIEVAVPIQTPDFNYQAEGILGFNITIDDDVDGDYTSDYSCSWQKYSGEALHIDSAQSLNCLQLVEKNDKSAEEQNDQQSISEQGKKSVNSVYIVIGIAAYVAGILTLVAFLVFRGWSGVNKNKQKKGR